MISVFKAILSWSSNKSLVKGGEIHLYLCSVCYNQNGLQVL